MKKLLVGSLLLSAVSAQANQPDILKAVTQHPSFGQVQYLDFHAANITGEIEKAYPFLKSYKETSLKYKSCYDSITKMASKKSLEDEDITKMEETALECTKYAVEQARSYQNTPIVEVKQLNTNKNIFTTNTISDSAVFHFKYMRSLLTLITEQYSDSNLVDTQSRQLMKKDTRWDDLDKMADYNLMVKQNVQRNSADRLLVESGSSALTVKQSRHNLEQFVQNACQSTETYQQQYVTDAFNYLAAQAKVKSNDKYKRIATCALAAAYFNVNYNISSHYRTNLAFEGKLLDKYKSENKDYIKSVARLVKNNYRERKDSSRYGYGFKLQTKQIGEVNFLSVNFNHYAVGEFEVKDIDKAIDFTDYRADLFVHYHKNFDIVEHIANMSPAASGFMNVAYQVYRPSKREERSFEGGRFFALNGSRIPELYRIDETGEPSDLLGKGHASQSTHYTDTNKDGDMQWAQYSIIGKQMSSDLNQYFRNMNMLNSDPLAPYSYDFFMASNLGGSSGIINKGINFVLLRHRGIEYATLRGVPCKSEYQDQKDLFQCNLVLQGMYTSDTDVFENKKRLIESGAVYVGPGLTAEEAAKFNDEPANYVEEVSIKRIK